MSDNSIKIAIYHRGDWYRFARIDGQFAYPVPGMTWTQHQHPRTKPIDLARVDADVVWLDDGKYKDNVLFANRDRLPVVYYALYPTLSPDIYNSRVKLAKREADLVMVEHDDLRRWGSDTGLPCRRLAYSVNERYYRDRGLDRDIDVGFYCVYAFNSERPALDAWLAGFCARKGYRYGTTAGESVGTKYAELLARTKVVIHLMRTDDTRPPRIFDTAASGAALLSNPLPQVSGEHFEPWVHYVPFNKPYCQSYEPFTSYKPMDDAECQEITRALEWLIDEGHWWHVAERAKAYVLACHTWEQRAKQLLGILFDEFPHLREKGGTEWMYQ